MWNIQVFAELPSTQRNAKQLLQSGKAKHGDVIIALHQTEGRGRFESRVWHDESGTNLLMSIVLTDIPSPIEDKMQFAAGLSVLRAMRTILPNEPFHIKWPNDILHNRKKISGVLSEAIWTGNSLKGVVIGIGINVNQEHFSGDIAARAISLKKISGQNIPLEEVRDAVLLELDRNLHMPADIFINLRNELEWMRGIGQFSLTDSDGTNFSGLRYEGITDDGALITNAPSGEQRIFQNGTLHFA
jgi:BirA family biotin operon repressor/biotin-[acetyl-CoA-carboxylase] ligase